MAKTYVPTLYFVVNHAYKYATRWQTRLNEALTSDQIACLGEWIAATLTLLTCIGRPPVNP